jgi:hypothetical protein
MEVLLFAEITSDEWRKTDDRALHCAIQAPSIY